MRSWDFRPARDLGLPPTERFRSLAREDGLLEMSLRGLWWSGIRTYLRWAHRLEVRGRERLPDRVPFVVVANHASHLDALALVSALPADLRLRASPLAAGDTFFESTVNSAFAAILINALPVWRKHADPADLRRLRRRLVDEPCGYVLFPEGTRTRTGAMARFRRGLGMLVAGTDVPVIPCHLSGTFEALPPGRKVPVPRRIIVRVGHPLRFGEVHDDKAGWDLVAATAESAVRALGQERSTGSASPAT